jgi:hypothetical protein
MWEMMMQMLMGNEQNQTGQPGSMTQNDPNSQSTSQPTSYNDNGSNADEGLAASKPTAKQPGMMSNMGDMAQGLLSPYTKGAQGVQDLYNDPSNRQALGSVLNMISPAQKKEQYQVPYTESNMPSMNSGNLGLPQPAAMSGPMMPNTQSRRSGLANQAFGRYY